MCIVDTGRNIILVHHYENIFTGVYMIDHKILCSNNLAAKNLIIYEADGNKKNFSHCPFTFRPCTELLPVIADVSHHVLRYIYCRTIRPIDGM